MTSVTNQTELKHFLPLCKLGQGAFSTVYKVKRVADGEIYALKKIKLQKLKQKQKQNSLTEIRILASIKSKYIVCYKEAFYDHSLNLLCIVMQYANGGDLHKRISDYQKSNGKFSQKQIWKAASQILMGLYVLHERNILHRDLKSANVFISNQSYKLGDLNVSKINQQKDQMARTQTGTPYYASPQVWRDQLYDSKCDIWSFGCVVYEMCCLRPPFQGEDLDQLYKAVQRGTYPEIQPSYSHELSYLIQCCLKVSQKQRLSAKQLLQRFLIFRQKHIQCYQNKQVQTVSNLLNTIRLPFDMRDLSKNLPTAQYQIPLRQQPQALYSQNNSKKQAIVPLNRYKYKYKYKQKVISKQASVVEPLPQRIKRYFNQDKITQVIRRPQRSVTSAKNRQLAYQIKLTRPQSAIYQNKKHIVSQGYGKQHRVRKVAISVERIRQGTGKQQVYVRPLTSDNKRADHYSPQIKQTLGYKRGQQYSSKQSSSHRHESYNSSNQNIQVNKVGRNNTSVSIQRQKLLNIKNAPNRQLTSIQNCLNQDIITNQKLFQQCRQNSLKTISSLQKKAIYIKDQRKQRKLVLNKNKQNVSCIIKHVFDGEDCLDLKKELQTKMRQGNQIFKSKNHYKAPFHIPIVKQRQGDYNDIKRLAGIGCLQNIQRRLQIRKNNISTRRYIVSAQNKRVKSFKCSNQYSSAVQKQDNRKFGVIRKIPSNLLPSFVRDKNNIKNKSQIMLAGNMKTDQVRANINNQMGNLIDDSDSIIRLRSKIKNRIICHNSQQKYSQSLNTEKKLRRNHLCY